MTSVRLSQEGWRTMQRKAHRQGRYGSEALNEAIAEWNRRHPDPEAPPVAPVDG